MTALPLTRDQIAAIQAWADESTFIATIRTDIPALCQQALRAIELEEQNSFWIGEINNLQVKMDVLKSELTVTRKALEEAERNRWNGKP